MRYRAARPVFRKGDDTHIHRATSLRSQPLATLAVGGCVTLSPARHITRAVLVGLRASTTVQATVTVVAFIRVALSRHYRYAFQPRCPSAS